jgi:hypothetical protein
MRENCVEACNNRDSAAYVSTVSPPPTCLMPVPLRLTTAFFRSGQPVLGMLGPRRHAVAG